MTNLREAAQMALDALKSWQKTCLDCGRPSEELGRATQPLQILRAALAQPEQEELGEIIPADEEQLNRIAKLVEQEPVAWKDAPSKIYLQVCEDVDCDLSFDAHDEVSWCQDKINDSDIPYVRADFATPEREWQGLNDEEIYLETNHIDRGERGWAVKFARAIEAKLREKNDS